MEFKSSAPEYVFNNENYLNYLVQYQGDIIGEFNNQNGIYHISNSLDLDIK